MGLGAALSHMHWLQALLGLLLAANVASERRPEPGAFVGWRGDSFDHAATFGGGATDRASQGVTERWIETLSWSPRAFLYHGFLTEKEADDLIYQAAPHLKRSTVVGKKESSNVVDNIRTSYGTFLNRLSSPTVEVLEKKLANWTQLPIIHQEDIQARCSRMALPPPQQTVNVLKCRLRTAVRQIESELQPCHDHG